MPRLIYFAPCLTPIISQEGVLSLVSVVEAITVPAPVSANAALPQPITAVAYFRREAADAERSFEVKLRIAAPSGRVLREREAEPFQIVDAGHRYLISIQDFPLATAGTYKLQLFLRERGVDERWRKVAEYPVDVAHIEVPG